jgi:LAO/AO transport system kinase
VSREIDVSALVEGVLAGDRRVMARAITLVESRRGDHREKAQELLVQLLPHAGGARRVGISGVPGVGKSTFIDQLGVDLTAAGSKVAVLAVDPSSSRSGGSILGDKTRMARLAVDPNAFIRPSPTSGTLGGVAQATRESMVVVEAAGYDVVLVETVGVGQSEVTVAEMVDSFLFLTLARTGDQLQGIKRGILEIADVIAVNKADGPAAGDARKAARELAGAIRMLRGSGGRGEDGAGWDVPVLTCAGLTGEGLDEVWAKLVEHQERMKASGAFDERRRTQQVRWTWQLVRGRLEQQLRDHPGVRAAVPDLEKAVLAGELTPALAAQQILDAFLAAAKDAPAVVP